MFYYLTFTFNGLEQQIVFESTDETGPLDDMVEAIAHVLNRRSIDGFEDVKVRIPSFEITFGDDE